VEIWIGVSSREGRLFELRLKEQGQSANGLRIVWAELASFDMLEKHIKCEPEKIARATLASRAEYVKI
jgi:hypothetical protein